MRKALLIAASLLFISIAFFAPAQNTPAVNSTGGQVYNAQAYGWLPDGTDRSAQALALISTICPSGVGAGGTIFFAASTGDYRADSQLFIPNTGSITALTCNIRFTGAGGGPQWEIGSGRTNMLKGASRLDLRYHGNNNGKIETEGQGTIEIDHLTFTDNATVPSFSVTGTTLTNIVVTSNTAVATFPATLNNGRFIGATWQVLGATVDADLNAIYDVTAVSSTSITFKTASVSDGTYNNGALTLTYAAPFIHSTASTLSVHDNAFIGAAGQASQDGVVLGGNSVTYSEGPAQNDPYNGYPGVVQNNSFAYMNRGVYLRTFANGVMALNNTFVRHNPAGALAAIMCDGASGGSGTSVGTQGFVFANNLIEMSAYKYGIVLQSCQNGQMIGNHFYDEGVQVVSLHYLSKQSYPNTISPTVWDTTKTLASDDAGGTAVVLNEIRTATPHVGYAGYSPAISQEIPYGINVGGRYTSGNLTTGYPGQFNVFDKFTPQSRLSIGVLTPSTFVIDAYTIGTGAQPLSLNPSGGAVAIGGNAAVAGTLNVTQQTPASAAATCVANQFAFDADFAYFCTATNTWKRVAIATW